MRAPFRVLAILLLASAAGCHRRAPAPPAQGTAAPAATPAAAEAATTQPATTQPATTQPETTQSAGSPAPTPTAWVLPEPDLGYSAREGRALFGHYCSTCHGAEGHGDGFNAYNLDPRPKDLGDVSYQAGHSDAEIADVIRGGGPSAGLSTAMPPWGRTLNPRQIGQLVAYVRTLKPEED